MKLFIKTTYKERIIKFLWMRWYSLEMESLHIATQHGFEFEYGPDVQNPLYRTPFPKSKLAKELCEWIDRIVVDQRDPIELFGYGAYDTTVFNTIWTHKHPRPRHIPSELLDLRSAENLLINSLSDDYFENATEFSLVKTRRGENPYTRKDKYEMFVTHFDYPQSPPSFIGMEVAQWMKKLERFLIAYIVHKNQSNATDNSQEFKES